MRKRFGFKPPLAVTQRQNRAYMLAQISDPEQRARYEANFPEANMKPLPIRRAPSVPSGKPLEADVLRAVGDLLAQHPKVCYALRINSGAASYEAKSGKYAPVWFHIWVKSPVRCRMPDFFGMLNDGRTLALEIKRPGFKHPRDEREYQQAAFLMLIRNMGGIGEFITDAEQVDALLA